MSAIIPIRSRPPYQSDVGRVWMLTGRLCSSHGTQVRSSFRRARDTPSARPPRGPGRRWRSLLLNFGFVFAQGIPAQFDPVGIVNDAVEDRVAQGGIPDDRVPV